MIPVLIPPAPAPIGSAAGPNAGEVPSVAGPGDGTEGATFVDLLSLLIATAGAPNAPPRPPLIVAAPDRAESLVGAEPVESADNEEATSLPSADENSLLGLQLLLAAMNAPPTPTKGTAPLFPPGIASTDSTEASVVRATTDPVVAPVTLTSPSQQESTPAPDIPASGYPPPEAVPGLGTPPSGRQPLPTSPESHRTQPTAPAKPARAETFGLTPEVSLPVTTSDPGGVRDAVAVASSAETLESTPTVPVLVPTNATDDAKAATAVASSTEPFESLQPPAGTVAPGSAMLREAAPPDGSAGFALREHPEANRHGEATRTVLAQVDRLNDRGASERMAPAERQAGSSSTPMSAAPSGISLPAVEPQGTPRDLARDQEEPRWARPEAPTGTERAEGAVGARNTTAAREAATVAAVRDESPYMNVERVVSAARASFARGGMEVRLHLYPESLGEVRVQVRWEGGTLSARLEAATPAARDALENGAPALRATLQEHGIPVERLSVNLRMDSETRSQHRPPASERPGGDDPARDGPSRTEPAPIPEPVSSGRVDIRI